MMHLHVGLTWSPLGFAGKAERVLQMDWDSLPTGFWAAFSSVLHLFKQLFRTHKVKANFVHHVFIQVLRQRGRPPYWRHGHSVEAMAFGFFAKCRAEGIRRAGAGLIILLSEAFFSWDACVNARGNISTVQGCSGKPDRPDLWTWAGSSVSFAPRR